MLLASLMLVGLQSQFLISSEKPLFDAIARGGLQDVQVQINAGVDVNAVSTATMGERKYLTPLMYAAQKGLADIVTLFLNDQNIVIDKQDEHGRTALMIAAQQGYPSIVAELLKKGANVNIQTPYSGATALIFACSNRYSNVEIVQQLLEAGADINHQEIGGDTRTALMEAILCQQWNIVEQLINAGADVNLLDKKGYSALFYAFQKQHQETVRNLYQHGARIDLSALNIADNREILDQDRADAAPQRGNFYSNPLIGATAVGVGVLALGAGAYLYPEGAQYVKDQAVQGYKYAQDLLPSWVTDLSGKSTTQTDLDEEQTDKNEDR